MSTINGAVNFYQSALSIRASKIRLNVYIRTSLTLLVMLVFYKDDHYTVAELNSESDLISNGVSGDLNRSQSDSESDEYPNLLSHKSDLDAYQSESQYSFLEQTETSSSATSMSTKFKLPSDLASKATELSSKATKLKNQIQIPPIELKVGPKKPLTPEEQKDLHRNAIDLSKDYKVEDSHITKDHSTTQDIAVKRDQKESIVTKSEFAGPNIKSVEDAAIAIVAGQAVGGLKKWVDTSESVGDINYMGGFEVILKGPERMINAYSQVYAASENAAGQTNAASLELASTKIWDQVSDISSDPWNIDHYNTFEDFIQNGLINFPHLAGPLIQGLMSLGREWIRYRRLLRRQRMLEYLQKRVGGLDANVLNREPLKEDEIIPIIRALSSSLCHWDDTVEQMMTSGVDQLKGVRSRTLKFRCGIQTINDEQFRCLNSFLELSRVRLISAGTQQEACFITEGIMQSLGGARIDIDKFSADHDVIEERIGNQLKKFCHLKSTGTENDGFDNTGPNSKESTGNYEGGTKPSYCQLKDKPNSSNNLNCIHPCFRCPSDQEPTREFEQVIQKLIDPWVDTHIRIPKVVQAIKVADQAVKTDGVKVKQVDKNNGGGKREKSKKGKSDSKKNKKSSSESESSESSESAESESFFESDSDSDSSASESSFLHLNETLHESESEQVLMRPSEIIDGKQIMEFSVVDIPGVIGPLQKRYHNPGQGANKKSTSVIIEPKDLCKFKSSQEIQKIQQGINSELGVSEGETIVQHQTGISDLNQSDSIKWLRSDYNNPNFILLIFSKYLEKEASSLSFLSRLAHYDRHEMAYLSRIFSENNHMFAASILYMILLAPGGFDLFASKMSWAQYYHVSNQKRFLRTRCRRSLRLLQSGRSGNPQLLKFRHGEFKDTQWNWLRTESTPDSMSMSSDSDSYSSSDSSDSMASSSMLEITEQKKLDLNLNTTITKAAAGPQEGSTTATMATVDNGDSDSATSINESGAPQLPGPPETEVPGSDPGGGPPIDASEGQAADIQDPNGNGPGPTTELPTESVESASQQTPIPDSDHSQSEDQQHQSPWQQQSQSQSESPTLSPQTNLPIAQDELPPDLNSGLDQYGRCGAVFDTAANNLPADQDLLDLRYQLTTSITDYLKIEKANLIFAKFCTGFKTLVYFVSGLITSIPIIGWTLLPPVSVIKGGLTLTFLVGSNLIKWMLTKNPLKRIGISWKVPKTPSTVAIFKQLWTLHNLEKQKGYVGKIDKLIAQQTNNDNELTIQDGGEPTCSVEIAKSLFDLDEEVFIWLGRTGMVSPPHTTPGSNELKPPIFFVPVATNPSHLELKLRLMDNAKGFRFFRGKSKRTIMWGRSTKYPYGFSAYDTKREDNFVMSDQSSRGEITLSSGGGNLGGKDQDPNSINKKDIKDSTGLVDTTINNNDNRPSSQDFTLHRIIEIEPRTTWFRYRGLSRFLNPFRVNSQRHDVQREREGVRPRKYDFVIVRDTKLNHDVRSKSRYKSKALEAIGTQNVDPKIIDQCINIKGTETERKLNDDWNKHNKYKNKSKSLTLPQFQSFFNQCPQQLHVDIEPGFELLGPGACITEYNDPLYYDQGQKPTWFTRQSDTISKLTVGMKKKMRNRWFFKKPGEDNKSIRRRLGTFHARYALDEDLIPLIGRDWKVSKEGGPIEEGPKDKEKIKRVEKQGILIDKGWIYNVLSYGNRDKNYARLRFKKTIDHLRVEACERLCIEEFNDECWGYQVNERSNYGVLQRMEAVRRKFIKNDNRYHVCILLKRRNHNLKFIPSKKKPSDSAQKDTSESEELSSDLKLVSETDSLKTFQSQSEPQYFRYPYSLYNIKRNLPPPPKIKPKNSKIMFQYKYPVACFVRSRFYAPSAIANMVKTSNQMDVRLKLIEKQMEKKIQQQESVEYKNIKKWSEQNFGGRLVAEKSRENPKIELEEGGEEDLQAVHKAKNTDLKSVDTVENTDLPLESQSQTGKLKDQGESESGKEKSNPDSESGSSKSGKKDSDSSKSKSDDSDSDANKDIKGGKKNQYLLPAVIVLVIVIAVLIGLYRYYSKGQSSDSDSSDSGRDSSDANGRNKRNSSSTRNSSDLRQSNSGSDSNPRKSVEADSDRVTKTSTNQGPDGDGNGANHINVPDDESVAILESDSEEISERVEKIVGKETADEERHPLLAEAGLY